VFSQNASCFYAGKQTTRYVTTVPGKSLAIVTVGVKERRRVLDGLQVPLTIRRILFSCGVHSCKMSLSVLVAVCCLLY
jgi:hypothetical protein